MNCKFSEVHCIKVLIYVNVNSVSYTCYSPPGDIVKVFYMCGEELLLAGGRVEVDTGRRSHYGSSFLTLATTVDTHPGLTLAQYRSFPVTLDTGRPRAGGEVRCSLTRWAAIGQLIRAEL